MAPLLLALRSRLVPALLTALGVVLITAGLLSYADPTTAGVPPGESAIVETPPPTPTSAPTASPSPGASPTDGPSASPSDGPSASPGERAVATRVVIPALDIDLPVVKPPGGAGTYPLCNVAMYIQDPMGQPGEGRATYIYAHARDGMFGPIYELAIVRHQGKKMLGMIVQVYTSDDRLYLYEIRKVLLHQKSLDGPLSATSEELWLQTSEGPRGTVGKTMLVAYPITVGAADHADAHPKPKPVVCG